MERVGQIFSLLLACSSPLLSAAIATSPASLLVCAPLAGCMQGVHMPGYQIARFEAYMGIPYARPPLGYLRFSSPKIMPKWQGIYNATAAKPDCIQKNYMLPTPLVYGEEDCLYLNVYRPERQRYNESLPVLVYIHGGGFFSGSAGPLITGPEYFMDTEAVVLVTMAYRLGALGFLSTHDALIPGNFGLKDQSMALRWVQRNIHAFGGNPQRVTLFGQSAGGVAAHMHMLSPQSAGLFRNVISMSSTANVPFAIQLDPLQQARKTAELCNIRGAQTMSTAKLTRALRNIDVQTLLQAGDGLKYWDVDPLTNYRPVVERGVTNGFFNVHPHVLMASGSYQKVPWLVGSVPEEGAVRVVNIMENATLREAFNSRFDALLQELLEFPTALQSAQLAPKMQLIMSEYFNDVHQLGDMTLKGFLDLITDRGFKQPLYNAIEGHVSSVDADAAPVFLYSFNYSGPHSFATIYTQSFLHHNYGVVHCDDLLYLFRSPMLFADFQRNSTDAKLVAAFVGYFVHFAMHGKPKDAELLGQCTKAVLQSRPNGICDYQEFVNVEQNAFNIKVAQAFPVSRVKLWNRILAES